ncbi:sigma-70 family RNA polymerase sigma factor [Sphingobacterium sp. SRCM116780]|uniref:RNA polymerase sigma factor n=1 Tax=Sphingobacterium sp. SRCM116780 TaxID=2907623 RepID=UPI001F298941|nr:sigma-70 family RNA polymerase sigma factor [Sphingobacterium sp. SRCM116780]UIR54988.1 sigma-70 family RNA polymerase sigma factor [Sphingobacterium sp. SRCM116780]
MSMFIYSTDQKEEDHILVDRYRKSGDLAILGDLYQRHTEMVYYVCLRYLQDQEMSKDAVMNIFEELIHKINKQEIKDFPRWLYVVSKNHCLMYLRAQKNKSSVSLDEFVKFPSELHQVEYDDEKEQQLTAMEGCMERLPEKQKETIHLFFLQEKCYQEISVYTGYSLPEVKSYIQNGKRNLKNCMETWHEKQ